MSEAKCRHSEFLETKTGTERCAGYPKLPTSEISNSFTPFKAAGEPIYQATLATSDYHKHSLLPVPFRNLMDP